MSIAVEPGTRPVLVGGHIGLGVHVARVILHLISIAAVITWIAGIYPPWILVLVVPSLAVETYALRRRAKRLWVTDLGSGFRVQSGSAAREFDDEDVFSLSFETRNLFFQGRYKGQRQRFVVSVTGENRPIQMDYRVPLGQTDPLAEFTMRIIGKYAARADDALLAGAVIHGEGWSLSNAELTLKSRRSAQILPVSDLASVAEVDGYVQLWKRGLDEPILKIPVGSQHSTLVLHLLARRVSDPSQDLEPIEGLGRVIFERRPSRLVGSLLFLLACVLSFIGVGMLTAGINEPELLGVGIGFTLAAIAVGTVAFSLKRSRFRCHQYGVYHKGLLAPVRQLRYDEVDEFTYVAIRQHHNGLYVGTSLQLILKPPPGSGKKRIRYFTSATNADAALEELRNQIAAAIGSRMLQRLSQGERVEWTKLMAITPIGLEYRPAGFVGRKDPILIPFEEIQGFNLQEGTFHLWQKGVDKSVVNVSSLLPNFFPGFWALCYLFQARSQEPGVVE